MSLLLKELIKYKEVQYELRLVGAPQNWGKKLADAFPNIIYLGELSDNDLEEEVSTWTLFINTVFWYSTGVTTKIGWALNRGLPIISTTAGLRGYKWKDGMPLIAESPEDMASKIINYLARDDFKQQVHEIKKIQNSAFTMEDITNIIKSSLQI
jgi:hypothetical protein